VSEFFTGGASGLVISDFPKVGEKTLATGEQALAIGSVGLLGKSGDAAFAVHTSNPLDTGPGAS
jgi:hypothetical protein